MTASVIGFERCSSARSSHASSHLSIQRGESAQGSTGTKSVGATAMPQASVGKNRSLEYASDPIPSFEGMTPHGSVTRRSDAARARSSRARSRLRSAKCRSDTPDWRMPSSWPLLRMSRSFSASANPSFDVDEGLEPLPRALGQLVLRPRDEKAERLLRATPDAAAQLVELREAEAVGLLDDHHRRVRDVHADLDHRRRDEHVDLARLELRHQLAALVRPQAAVQAARRGSRAARRAGAARPRPLRRARRSSRTAR